MTAWSAAAEAFARGAWADALAQFSAMEDSSARIAFNLGNVYLQLGRGDDAVAVRVACLAVAARARGLG